MFSLKNVISDSDLEPFYFLDAENQEQSLPHPGALTTRQVFHLQKGKFEEVLEEIDPGSSSALLDVPSYALEALLSAWLEHGGAEAKKDSAGPGKSSKKKAKR